MATEEGYTLLSVFDWVEELGLELAEAQPTLDEEFVEVSTENVEELEASMIRLRDDAFQSELEEDPRFQELGSVQNDAVLWATSENNWYAASTTYGPSSFTWFLEEAVRHRARPLAGGRPGQRPGGR